MKRLVFIACLFVSVSARAAALGGCEQHVEYGAPAGADVQTEVLLCRLGYALSFNTEQRVADWVAYHLTTEKVTADDVERTEDFRPDPDLEPGKRSELDDYKNSGFDRGHLAPAASMRWSPAAMSQSFLLSNMAPQIGAGFNQHIWKRLERYVRQWTERRSELYVVTGPIYGAATVEKIKPGKAVSVPTHFYKVIFDPRRVEAIAFILPHQKLKTKDLPTFIRSVDDVEDQTGLDFLWEIQDVIEDQVEAAIQPRMWKTN